MDVFVIAWKTDAGILYLLEDSAGATAVEDVEFASQFGSYAEGYASFKRWQSALSMLDGAVLRTDEIEAQFDPNLPSPRQPFNISEEAVGSVLAQAAAEVQQAQTQLETIQQQFQEVSIKASAFDRIAAEHPDLTEAALAAA